MSYLNPPPTSLARTAAITVVASVWYHEDVAAVAKRGPSEKNAELWQNTEDKVIENLCAFSVPITVKQFLMDLCQPMGKQIKNWVNTHSFLDLQDSVLPSLLFWDPQGTIDLKETAKRILTNGPRVEKKHFRIACMYSIEEAIVAMWPKLLPIFKPAVQYVMCNFDPQVLFWMCYLEKNIDQLMVSTDYVGYKDDFHFALWLSINSNNHVSSKYFLSKLTLEQRQKMVGKMLTNILESHSIYHLPIIPLLLPYLSESEIHEVFTKHPLAILRSFLKWPLQCFFLDVANKIWDNLQEKDYYHILEDIAHNVSEFHRSQIYINIFKGFWHASPVRCRNYTVRKCIDGTFLIRLCSLKHTDYILRLIIECLTEDEKHGVIFSPNGILSLESLIRKERWDTIYMMFHECLPLENRTMWVEKLKEICYNAFDKNVVFINITPPQRVMFLSVLRRLM